MYGENGNSSVIEKYRPFVYWRDSGQTAEEVYEQVRLSAAAGVGGFIPLPISWLPEKRTLNRHDERPSAPRSPPAIMMPLSWVTPSLRRSPYLWNGNNS